MTDNFYLQGENITASDPYEYVSCGLDGIYLLNGFELHTHDGEEYVSIKDVEGLHIAIGKYIVLHRKALVPQEVKFLRRTMEMTQEELAASLGKNSQSVARWEKGQNDIPGTEEKLLRLLFYARCVMTDDDLLVLRDLIVEKLSELDHIDEVATRPVQFALGDQWIEQAAA